jgi:DnaJ-class molecular chaperone
MNPYDVLGIDIDASDKDIKIAYRKLAMKHHPDKGGDPEQFKQVSQAYETLSNSQKKQQYDNFGSMNLDMDFDPKNIFKVFERDFFGPHRIGAPPFGGFTMFSNQSDQFNGLNMFLGGIGAGGMTSFSQTTIIKGGKKITKTTRNGTDFIYEVNEELLGDPYTTKYNLTSS